MPRRAVIDAGPTVEQLSLDVQWINDAGDGTAQKICDVAKPDDKKSIAPAVR